MAKASQETIYLLGTPTKSNHNFKYGEALMHLVKGYIGTGIFSMGNAVKRSGLILGPIYIIFLGAVCLHCCHLLVNTSSDVQERNKLVILPDYAKTAELCFKSGNSKIKVLAPVAKLTVNTFLILAQMGFCCAYLVFIATNIQEFLKAHNMHLCIHWILVLVLVPIWLTTLIRNLKYLAPFSVTANILLMISLVIVLFYAFERPLNEGGALFMSPGPAEFAMFFGQSIFAFEGVGLVLILYNEMKEPALFNSACGVLNIGLFIVTFAYLFFGCITYLQFGDNIKETVTLNLDSKHILAQIVLVLISIGVMLTFALQLYVVIDIIWPKIVEQYGPFGHPVLKELIFRTGLVLIIFAMAEAIPKLELLLAFIGSFTSVALIIIFPAIMDVANFYTTNKLTYFVAFKDLALIILGIFGMFTGTYESLSFLTKSKE